MSQSILQQQSKLPASIQLFRYSPERSQFSLKAWDPTTVRLVEDLPPYLILGDLDEDSFEKTASGWSAVWQGTEHDTFFSVKYLADQGQYEIRQQWCGVEGGYGTFSSKISLDKLIFEALYVQFPTSWDRKAKEDLESKFQVTYIEQPKDFYNICGIPDGPFRVIAFPVAIKNMRYVRNWLQEITSLFDSRYPINAEARLMFQAINYLEGEAPEWTTNAPVVFNHSLTETGIAPHNFPVKETAQDGSSAWTLRRDVYVIFISLPFAGLTDLLEKMCTTNGPIRYSDDSYLRIELKPIVMPPAFELQTEGLTFWDKGRTTRSLWQFSDKPPHTVKDVIQGDKDSEELLSAAERISARVTEAIQQIANGIFRTTEA